MGDSRARRSRRATRSWPARPRSRPRRRIVELLTETGELVGDPKPITHPVKFYERGSRPLEIVTSRQWYFRNGGREPELRATFLARGRELRWHPPHMRQRYESWVEGLNTDWLISRQRFFGVPFPVWYRLRPDGEVDYDDLAPAERGPAAGRSVERRARRLHRGPARRARRLHRRPRRDGHLGDVVAHAADRHRLGRRRRPLRAARSRWTCARRGRRSSARGSSTRSCGPTSSTARCRGPTRRSTGGFSILTARRCRRARATSSRRCRCSSSTAPTRCGTGPRTVDPARTPRSTRAR